MHISKLIVPFLITFSFVLIIISLHGDPNMFPSHASQNRTKLLVHILHTHCHEFGLSYVAIGGTILGAVRHGDMIPWDDDADVAMELSAIEVLIEQAALLRERHNIIVTHHNEGLYKFKFANHHEFIDIFEMRRKDDGRYEYAAEWVRSLWPRQNLDSMQTTKLYPFGSCPDPLTGHILRVSVKGPADAEAYLDRSFGDWHQMCVDMPHAEVVGYWNAHGLMARKICALVVAALALSLCACSLSPQTQNAMKVKE